MSCRRPTIQLALALCVLALALPACAGSHFSAARTELKLASWNLDWLVTPATFATLKPACVPADGDSHRGRRAMPCDVAAQLERSATDLAALAGYARNLDADVIALQEVDGAAAAGQLFPGYDFCFSASPALQNTGFAVRRGLPFRCGPDLAALSLGERVRRGAVLTLFPGSSRELHLLGVHLKSGCWRGPLTGGAAACALLAEQAPLLREWLASQPRGVAFALLGDFNRDLQHERGPARDGEGRLRNLWPELADAMPAGVPLRNAAEGSRFNDCSPGGNHRGYIDQILLGGPLAERMVEGSFRHEGYNVVDAAHYVLSDHCPVSVRVRLR